MGNTQPDSRGRPRFSVIADRIARTLKEAGFPESDDTSTRDAATARTEGFKVWPVYDNLPIIAMVRWLPARAAGQAPPEVGSRELRQEIRMAWQAAPDYAAALKAAGYNAEVRKSAIWVEKL